MADWKFYVLIIIGEAYIYYKGIRGLISGRISMGGYFYEGRQSIMPSLMLVFAASVLPIVFLSFFLYRVIEIDYWMPIVIGTALVVVFTAFFILSQKYKT